MSRVSVAEGQKPKPKESFKFLRRDEGRLSYSADANSPSANTPKNAGVDRPRKDSKSLREAIAHDMKAGKSQDPFGDVVVAVPKRAPPPNASAAAPKRESEQRPVAIPAARKPRPSSTQAKKPAWVGPDVPSYDHPREIQYSEKHEEPQEYDDDEDQEVYTGNNNNNNRYQGGTPRDAGRRSYGENNNNNLPPPASRRYMDPSSNYNNNNNDFFDDDVPRERNYFKPRGNRAPQAPPARSEDDSVMLRQLEDEIGAAQEERARYMRAKQALDREKKAFEDYKYDVEQQLEDERRDQERYKRTEHKEANREVRSLEERYRNVSALLSTEREANKRLTEENDSLRQQLEDLTSTMRENQKVSKAELARLRRDVESLTKRNAELLAMTKESQIHQIERASSSVATPHERIEGPSPTAISNYREPSQNKSQQRKSLSITDSNSAATPEKSPVAQPRRKKQPPPQTQIVMDFTPRAMDDEAAEKRSREIEEKMKREEKERQLKRQQREKETAERKARELEEAERREEERIHAEKLKAEEAKARRDEELKAKKEQQLNRQPQHDSEEISKERKRSGHPATTPRGRTKSATGKVASRSTKDSGKKRIPTREELVGDEEEVPAEEFPNDSVVSKANIGESVNKQEVLYRSGKREIQYANGTVKVVLPSGHTILHFTNGDVKRMFPSGKSTYWYEAAQTLHTQRPDGVQTYEFKATGQTERHHSDGSKEILYPDGIFKVVHPDGSEETLPVDEKA